MELLWIIIVSPFRAGAYTAHRLRMWINFFIGQSSIATIYHRCVALLYPLFHIQQCTILSGVKYNCNVAGEQFFPLEPIVKARGWPLKASAQKKVCSILWAASPGRFFLQGMVRPVAEGILWVEDDTVIVTYYRDHEKLGLKQHYQNLPQKLQSQGINPKIPWLFDFKLDFRFKWLK